MLYNLPNASIPSIFAMPKPRQILGPYPNATKASSAAANAFRSVIPLGC